MKPISKFSFLPPDTCLQLTELEKDIDDCHITFSTAAAAEKLFQEIATHSKDGPDATALQTLAAKVTKTAILNTTGTDLVTCLRRVASAIYNLFFHQTFVSSHCLLFKTLHPKSYVSCSSNLITETLDQSKSSQLTFDPIIEELTNTLFLGNLENVIPSPEIARRGFTKEDLEKLAYQLKFLSWLTKLPPENRRIAGQLLPGCFKQIALMSCLRDQSKLALHLLTDEPFRPSFINALFMGSIRPMSKVKQKTESYIEINQRPDVIDTLCDSLLLQLKNKHETFTFWPLLQTTRRLQDSSLFADVIKKFLLEMSISDLMTLFAEPVSKKPLVSLSTTPEGTTFLTLCAEKILGFSFSEESVDLFLNAFSKKTDENQLLAKQLASISISDRSFKAFEGYCLARLDQNPKTLESLKMQIIHANIASWKSADEPPLSLLEIIQNHRPDFRG